MKAKISEIFRSIQGEGKYVGIPQVFVRFFGCNLECSWCDTPSSWKDKEISFEEFDLDEVLFHIDRLNTKCNSVSFTGGEPLLQADFLTAILPQCKQRGLRTYLDTNGICFGELKKVIEFIDIIAMDIKMPSSAKSRVLWVEHKEFLDVAKRKDLFVKTVVSLDTKEEDVVKVVELIKEADKNILLILQPNSFELKKDVINKCYEFLNVALGELPSVRIMPQMHKLLGVR